MADGGPTGWPDSLPAKGLLGFLEAQRRSPPHSIEREERAPRVTAMWSGEQSVRVAWPPYARPRDVQHYRHVAINCSSGRSPMPAGPSFDVSADGRRAEDLIHLLATGFENGVGP